MCATEKHCSFHWCEVMWKFCLGDLVFAPSRMHITTWFQQVMNNGLQPILVLTRTGPLKWIGMTNWCLFMPVGLLWVGRNPTGICRLALCLYSSHFSPSMRFFFRSLNSFKPLFILYSFFKRTSSSSNEIARILEGLACISRCAWLTLEIGLRPDEELHFWNTNENIKNAFWCFYLKNVLGWVRCQFLNWHYAMFPIRPFALEKQHCCKSKHRDSSSALGMLLFITPENFLPLGI